MPGWRGPLRTAYSPAETWPEQIDEAHLKLRWEVPFGKSYSGPLVVGEQIFVTESVADNERVTALARGDGQVQWKAEWPGSMSVPFFAASNGSWIRSTPVTDGSRIFVGGMRDFLACLRTSDGELLYSIDFVKQFESPLPAFGQVCSPLLDQDRLYLQSAGGLVCLQCEDGKTVWRTMVETDGMMSSAFSSPIIATLHGVRQLLVQTRSELCGVDLSNGQPLWRQKIESFRGMNILTPTVWKDCVFTSSYGGKSLMLEFEPNASGPWMIRERWSSKAEAYMSSPILIDDHIYLHLRNQRFTCLAADDGSERWRTRPYGKYWSMITNGQRILALDEQGKLFLIAPNPDAFQLLDERKIADEECWSHLAISNRQLFIRSLAGLKAFDWI